MDYALVNGRSFLKNLKSYHGMKQEAISIIFDFKITGY
ncbi:hypothetical protein HNP68_000965 [Borrelia yangtzensis]|uniref:Uncharacterized protein n=1 Tax=Borreliella yangtzensis TaxID=683292 RepID=A0ABR6PB55_9SPIR|nr:hypothetical protein [Borreliella yangtzensis]MBB6043343.1 hypothetical protein [Borreliella yangtzensis]